MGTIVLEKSESRIQQDCVMWFRNTYCLRHMKPRYAIFSVSNEHLNERERMRAHAMGVMAGVSDIVVMLDKRILFFEIKDKKGRASAAQLEFATICEQLCHPYYIVRDFASFQQIVNTFVR